MDCNADKSDPFTRPEPQPVVQGVESTWQVEAYPERAGEPDCIYFLRTGSCGYGDRCRFNHPPNRSRVPRGRSFAGGDHPERADQQVCQYFVKTGTCKFGTSCKYHHPKQGAVSDSPFALNIHGYPLRPGEKECGYYIRTGQCKFGVTCKFHHPNPINVQVPTTTSSAMPPAHVAVYSPIQFPSSPSPGPPQYRMVTGNWPIVRPPMMPGSYMQGPYGPFYLPSGMVPLSGWGPYSVPNSITMPTNPSTVEGGQLYGMTPAAASPTTYSGTFPAIPTSAGPSSGISNDQSLPHRPGQPQCQYYLKTGDCKFGMSCKYHHPTEWVVHNQVSPALSPMGLPLRAGTPVCSFYAQHGVCRFGPTCKFDHPMGTLSYSSSASSLADMPVAPYPVATSMGTLAPSSSSSDLPTEGVMTSSNKVPSSILVTSMPISSGSGGSILSKNGSISEPGPQRTHQTPSISSTTSSADHEGVPS